jgi:DNA-binding HxlR family transcriptional regulator
LQAKLPDARFNLVANDSIAEMDCAIARALARIGDKWTLLILRNAFNGMKRFDHFQAHLGLASNILADRLRKLTDAGILMRRRLPDDGRGVEYKLTEKGLELYPVLVSLLDWGEKWEGNGNGPRLLLLERDSGRPIAPMAVRADDGRALTPQEVTVAAGPGASGHVEALLRTGGTAAPKR